MNDLKSLSKGNPRKYYYKGSVAARYDKDREAEEKWQLELDFIGKIIAEIEVGTSILDVPLGTGRFLGIYEQGRMRTIVGIDISMDMLLQAKQKNSVRQSGNDVYMIVGDAERLPIKDNSVDYVVCIRFLNWLSEAHFTNVLKECHRVARRGLIVGVRVYCSLHPQNLIQLRSPYIKLALGHMFKSMIYILRKLIINIGSLDISFKRRASMVREDPYNNGANEFKFHDKNHVLNIFAERKLKIYKKFSFDVRWDDNKKLVLPYIIYFLKR